tara:strand:+ start:1132 stop:2175 length:1044 start_codon:yes stop_codon:yes gene_type:complete
MNRRKTERISNARPFWVFYMSDEEQQAEPEPETTESVPPLEDHHEEAMKEMTLEERQEALKRSRWNVFLYLGLAALMFGFALFPFPFTATAIGDTYEQDLGFVWGPPLDGEDFTDVPIEIEITATVPPTNSNARIAVYLLNSDDCASSEILDIKRDSRANPTHDYQYQISDKAPIVDEVFVFEFDVDGGGQCLFAEYVDKDNTGNTLSGTMEIDGSMWPNQIWAGILAVLFLGLSGFAFLGAQRHGEGVKALTEPSKKTTEEEVLATAGPTGPPPSAAGPSGPPPSSPGPSGPPPAEEAVDEPEAAPTEPVFEAAENGYFFRKMPDGSYDQTVYVQAEDGSYVPYEG